MTVLDLAKALFRGFKHFANVLDLAIKEAEERQNKKQQDAVDSPHKDNN